MENEKPTRGKRSRCLKSDIISTLPRNIIESILSLLPIEDALKTSVLSKKWRYSWRSMPKLVFRGDMITVPSNLDNVLLEKYKLVYAIFHVLLLHNGPTIVEFNCSVRELGMVSEIDQIISHLSRGNNVKELSFFIHCSSYKLPASFFSLQGLERIHLESCTFEPPLACSIFSWLRSLKLMDVEVSAQMLQRFLSKCPLLDELYLSGSQIRIDFAAGNRVTFLDFIRSVPLIRSMEISQYYMEYLRAGGMPHKLPTSLVHLKCLSLEVCLVEQNVLSSALCITRSSPVLERILITMYDNEILATQQTPTNFLDPENHLDLNLDRLVIFEIHVFTNSPLEMEFMKLIMAKSPILKKARVELDAYVSNDEELKILRDMLLLPLPRASPSAKLTVVRPTIP